jgi:uncharacterized protein YyaL (SSP411 family)
MPNRLVSEASPYLLQHAENPVDWYPWGETALERARAEDRPILLSIGYAACHWCHVMAHESFEDPETAALMNERFINVKVDREERPDLDAIYMQAVQALTGHGGWPMTVFLMPDGAPFYGGTYFPPRDRHGLPSFRRVLQAVSDAWKNRRDSVNETAEQLRRAFAAGIAPRTPSKVDRSTLESAYRILVRSFDPAHAGFGGAPKFPPTMVLDFLIRYASRTGASPARDMATQTFLAMARGGIFDQIGGGIHRYSVDERWLVPHFEKMLYDNALFVRLGAHLWQITKDDEIRHATESTVDWVLREMRSPEGAFYSSLDADSEGEEGKFYVWDWKELANLLGADADTLLNYWGATPEGNFEGHNILHRQRHGGAQDDKVLAAESRARETLLSARTQRVRPGVDDKILAAWNGLMVRGIAEAARVFQRHDYRDAAIAAAEFLWRQLVRHGRAQRVYRQGITKGPGFLEDQAALGLAFLDLYSLTLDQLWVERAVEMGQGTVGWFLDHESSLFFDTASDHEALIARPRELTDNATPSGNSLAAELLFRIAEFCGAEQFRGIAEGVVERQGELLARHPNAVGHLLGVADGVVHGAVEVALVGPPDDDRFCGFVRLTAETYVPSLVLAGGEHGDGSAQIALLRGRENSHGATAYVCRRSACETPARDLGVFADQLARAGVAE